MYKQGILVKNMDFTYWVRGLESGILGENIDFT